MLCVVDLVCCWPLLTPSTLASFHAVWCVCCCPQMFCGSIPTRFATGLPVHMSGTLLMAPVTRLPYLPATHTGPHEIVLAQWNRELFASGMESLYPQLLETLTTTLPDDVEGNLLFQFWPLRANIAQPLEPIVPRGLHTELSTRRVFCLARGGPSSSSGQSRYVTMHDGYFKHADIPAQVLTFAAKHFPLFDAPTGLVDDLASGTPAPRMLSPAALRFVAFHVFVVRSLSWGRVCECLCGCTSA